MNWKNKGFVFAVIGLLFAACSEGVPEETTDGLPVNFTIEGTIEGANNTRVYLEAATQDGIVDVAKTQTDGEGKFTLYGNIPAMGFYELRLGETEKDIVPVTLQPDDKVTLTATKETFAFEPKFEGTEWAAPLTKYMQLFSNFSKEQAEFARNNQNADRAVLMEAMMKGKAPIDAFSIEQIKSDLDNPVNLILTSSLAPSPLGFEDWDTTNLDIMRDMQSAFAAKYPGSPIVKQLGAQIEQLDLAYQNYIVQKNTPFEEEAAPEIAMNSPEGKPIKLSDLRGKYVLVDFWASWCGPCRRENPNVVRMYNKYKSKGFTILSVSLDDNKDKWKNAILQDGLIWPNHVSDLLGWKTPMTQIYGFNGIPHTVLVDPKGNIIARNLRGAGLEQKLEEVL